MELIRGKRFSLLVLEGYAITPENTAKRLSLSYSIVDRDYHKTVWTDFSRDIRGNAGLSRASRLKNAELRLSKFEEGVMQSNDKS